MSQEQIIIRLEKPEDYLQTEFVVREAFWDVYRPGCHEHFILHKIKQTSDYIKEMNFVACIDNKIVGIIVCPKAKIINEQNQEFPVLSMMVGVLPTYQKKGVGSMLIKQAITAAKFLGYAGIVIFGNPEYYQKFGFRNAINYQIHTSDGQNFDPFMALELTENSLSGIKGKFLEASAFQPELNNDELELFDAQFPHKEKHVTDTQLKFD